MIVAAEGMSASLGAALGAGVLASVVFSALALLGARVFANNHAASRHLLWDCAMIATTVAAILPLSGRGLTLRVPSDWLFQVASSPESAPIITSDMTRVRAAASVGPRRTADMGRLGVDLMLVLVLVWITGALFVAGRVVLQFTAAAALRRRAVPVSGVSWHAILARARVRAGFTRPVALLVSPETDVPFVTGLVRHAVIVPVSSSEWSNDEWHSVVAHEVSHLVRRDPQLRAVSMLLCAMHWFNPLIWWLAARSQRDAEMATDALVLASGVKPSVYAGALLSLAERAAPAWSPRFALLFARRGSLEPRVRAVLGPRVLDPGMRRGTRWCTPMVFLVAATGVGGVRLVPGADLPAKKQRAPSSATFGIGVPAARVAPVSRPSGRGGVTARLLDNRRDRRALSLAQSPAAAAVPGPVALNDTAESGTDWTAGAVAGLIVALRDSSSHVRLAAAEALGAFGTAGAEGALQRARGDSDRSVRDAVNRALASFRGNR